MPVTHNPVLLVVEDDTDAADVVRWLMEPRGYTCQIYERAEDALAYIGANPDTVNGVIADFHLPGIDGIEFGRQLRVMLPGHPLPLIGTTAFHTPELRAKALEVGFDAYFAKPLNVNEFAPAVENLVSR